MSQYIADKKWNGTTQRRIAYVLDHHLISAGKRGGNDHFVLRDSRGVDSLVDALVASMLLPLPFPEGELNGTRSLRNRVNALRAQLTSAERELNNFILSNEPKGNAGDAFDAFTQQHGRGDL